MRWSNISFYPEKWNINVKFLSKPGFHLWSLGCPSSKVGGSGWSSSLKWFYHRSSIVVLAILQCLICKPNRTVWSPSMLDSFSLRKVAVRPGIVLGWSFGFLKNCTLTSKPSSLKWECVLIKMKALVSLQSFMIRSQKMLSVSYMARNC